MDNQSVLRLPAVYDENGETCKKKKGAVVEGNKLFLRRRKEPLLKATGGENRYCGDLNRDQKGDRLTMREGVSSKQLNDARVHHVPRAGKRKGEAVLVPVHGGETLLGGELKERLEDGVFVRIAVVVVDDVDCGTAQIGRE